MERNFENGFEFFRDHANSMYGVQDSSTLKNRARLAEEICRIEQQTADNVRELARSRILEQKLISMRYDWELHRRKLDHQHSTSLRHVLQVVDTSVNDLRVRIHKLQEDSVSLESNMRDSYNITRRHMSKELCQVRSTYNQILLNLRETLTQNFVKRKVQLSAGEASAVDAAEIDARAHIQRILEIHRNQEADLTAYFGNIISTTESDLSAIRLRVCELKAKVEKQSNDISRLQRENETVSYPLDDLNKQRTILLEDLEVVESGSMARKNFKQLKTGLERKLARLNIQINEMEEVIKKLDATLACD
jgi:hypothetical protein